ncbi:hypothetical protein KY320_01120 [Candidatus Woesearchaeota archaeon]|nr:hypothetical protein [Candidatus Woesearchaeota archaeon]
MKDNSGNQKKPDDALTLKDLEAIIGAENTLLLGKHLIEVFGVNPILTYFLIEEIPSTDSRGEPIIGKRFIYIVDKEGNPLDIIDFNYRIAEDGELRVATYPFTRYKLVKPEVEKVAEESYNNQL